ncbi:flagellar export protein FliJ [Desulfosporosinus metallidurans]|uniref:Flagellar protein FliJ n=1 Tax=Desulfosporosinus metallidurans TaxID=1888891 RepID=A0A1Q8R230_9FIRM|nr:flagellar export protein FliJ [Desulfosporosinus metallidurans]OLN33500.1 Flagellar protein FliJ [Desulfosporosinus metallidurans]
MARFRFRLETSLRLAKKALEAAQREFAQEEQRWQVCVRACALQQERFNEAEVGQRDAGRHRPEELGNWQIFASEQWRRLRQCEVEQREQQSIMEDARRLLLETHREVEKFRRLKEKQAKAFQWSELQKEQKLLDETGQILYWRQEKSIKS